ncbi:hypothetical protein D3Z60_02290 [Lachnospiraceae bacterium]|jgi:hypothetical protein|nr:hypothetical protein [Lachnospiraceae bacterium]
MKNILVLKDGSEIGLETGASLPDMKVLSDTKQDMVSVWDRLTENNLSEVQIKDGDGLIVATYQNLILDSETSTLNKDRTVLTSFKLRGKTEVEFLMEMVESLENRQEVQDGAITDLGAAVSRLAEEGGLA